MYSLLKWKLKHATDLQKQKGVKCDKGSEVKGIWSARKSSIYGRKGRKVSSEVKWSEVKWFWSREEIEYFQEQVLGSDKWSEGNLKWEEYQLNAVNGRELR